MLIDAHCHLDDAQFADDLESVIQRAQDAGVQAIISAGASLESSRAAVALADRFDCVYAMVGIHPEHAAMFDHETLKAIRELASHRKVIGIGEIGLDFYWKENPPHEIQERALIAQMELAAELDKPIAIHDRNAHVELLTILQTQKMKARGVLHCFSGDLAMAHQAIDQGFMISFAGNLTFKNARELQTIARDLPLDHIVIETDAPYLSPLRGKRNEPGNVARVAEKISELKQIELSVAQLATTKNSERLFGLDRQVRNA